MRRSGFTPMHLLAPLALIALCACANMGRPGGGPRDEQPPTFVRSNPMPGTRNFDKKHIDLWFDENIQLEDAFNKVVVSPVQVSPPQISSNGRHISIELRDSLLPGTTYTVDFADAIKDLNEGNVLDGFAIDFSTGDSIDSLRISGMVLEARTLEPAQGFFVGVYNEWSDTAITTRRFDRIARTNQLGQFTIRNLKPGNYRVYALRDLNRDYHWDRTEDIAFTDMTVSPWTEEITVTDTLMSREHTDSLVQRQGIRYMPNDVLLTWFNENYQALYLKDYARPERNRITLGMATTPDSMPSLTIVGGPMDGRSDDTWALRQVNTTRDSLQYWIADSAVLSMDSLMLAVRYRRVDNTDTIRWSTDTLRFFFREPRKKKETPRPTFTVTEEGDTIPLPVPTVHMRFSPVTSSTQELNRPVVLEAEHPIDTIDQAGVHLAVQRDTTWVDIPNVTLAIDSMQPFRRRLLSMTWEEGAKYRLSVDSAAVRGIYGLTNNTVNHEFTIKKSEEYTSLTMVVHGLEADDSAIVELLDGSDKPVAIAPVVDGKAVLRFLAPGTYYARLYIDDNGNGEWDTGSLIDGRQAEEVFYYSHKLNLRKNWDVEQTWNIYELPVDRQKPYAILQNKPKLKRGEEPPIDPDELEDDDPLANPFGPGMNQGNQRNNRRGNNRNNNNNRGNQGLGGFGNQGGLGGLGGLRR